MTRLKDFIDFALSLVDMEEVQNNKFPLPVEMVFELSEHNHNLVQRELHDEKGDGVFESMEVFEMVVFGINFKFTKK